jgi:myo-inositol catabolism protein IolC
MHVMLRFSRRCEDLESRFNAAGIDVVVVDNVVTRRRGRSPSFAVLAVDDREVGVEFRAQHDAAEHFLDEHEKLIIAARDKHGLSSELDFGVDMADVRPVANHRFGVSFMERLVRLGIELNVTTYKSLD